MTGEVPAALLSGVIDDAGVFPPAGKAMGTAVADHVAARGSAERWMLGRFLCPVSRLEELTDLPDAVPQVGAVFDIEAGSWEESARAGFARLRDWSRSSDVTSVELRLPGRDAGTAVRQLTAARLMPRLAGTAGVFLEVVGWDSREVTRTREAIAQARVALPLGAKLRLGGVSAEAFPPSEVVATFIAQAQRLGVPFKATAGLHHPFRTMDNELGVLQHGFINLLAASALREADTEAVLDETDPTAFTIDADCLRWRGHRAGAHAVAQARRLLAAFGSCSLDEPVEELALCGILPRRLAA